jgi:hypothetical protein
MAADAFSGLRSPAFSPRMRAIAKQQRGVARGACDEVNSPAAL